MADNSSILNALKGVDPADAMPFGAGTTPEGSPTALSSMLTGLFGMPKHLIDAAKGFNPADIHGSTEQVIPAAADTAMALAGTGAPAAEAGAAGIFGGKLAKTADIKALIEANKMAESKAHPFDILEDTGWFKSPTDNKWKFEISDDKSRMIGHGQEYSPKTESNSVMAPAHMMFQHPDLWKAYPQLADIPLRSSVFMNPRNGVGTGSYSTPFRLGGVFPVGSSPAIKQGLLEVNAPSLDAARSVSLHELQHGVQGIENFSQGSNPNYMAYLKEKKPSNIPSFEGNTNPFDMYQRLGGEVESRNVQKRMDYSPERRLGQPAWDTHDTKYNDQLVLDPRTDMVQALRKFK